MTIKQLSVNNSFALLPEAWQSDIKPQLSPEENVLSSVEVDLDARLHFVKGLIVVTDRRLLAKSPGETEWKAWPYSKGLQLRHHDHAGVGHLELLDENGRLASWRFTLGQNLLAIRVLDQFKEQLESHITGCKAILEPEQDECPVCTKVIYTPPSTWTLFRLWRFAQPYRWQLAAGFALMLMGTAAHMIPAYLTMPLMDNVLIPYQKAST